MTTVRRWKVRNKFIGTLTCGGFKPYGNTRIGLRPTFDWAAKKVLSQYRIQVENLGILWPKFVPSCTYYISVSIYIYMYIYYNDGFFGGHMGGLCFFLGGDELKCCCPHLEYILGCGLPLPARSKSWSLKMLASWVGQLPVTARWSALPYGNMMGRQTCAVDRFVKGPQEIFSGKLR